MNEKNLRINNNTKHSLDISVRRCVTYEANGHWCPRFEEEVRTEVTDDYTVVTITEEIED